MASVLKCLGALALMVALLAIYALGDVMTTVAGLQIANELGLN